MGSLNEFRDRSLVVGSLSKTYAMTGWRLGYALGPTAVVGAVQKLQSQSKRTPRLRLVIQSRSRASRSTKEPMVCTRSPAKINGR